MVAYVPEEREYLPLSPMEDSMLQMVVPYEIWLTGRTLPVETVALRPQKMYWPE